MPGTGGGTRAAEHVIVDAEVMGTFHVVVDGLEIRADAWQRSAAARLFKLLLTTPRHRLAREAAAEVLWPDMEPGHQATNLRKALHFARRALEQGRPVIVAGQNYIALAPRVELRLDLNAWQEAASRLRRRGVDEQSDPLADPDVELVLRLGQQPVLPDDLYADWIEPLRERVWRQWRDLAIQVASSCVQTTRYAMAETLLDELLSEDPADEEAHRIMIVLLVAQGRDHAARSQFLRCASELAAAFGIEPCPATAAALRRPDRRPDRRPRRSAHSARNAGGTPMHHSPAPVQSWRKRGVGGQEIEAPTANGLEQPTPDTVHAERGRGGRSCNRPARTGDGCTSAKHRDFLSG